MATGCLHPSPFTPAMPLPFEADLNGDADEDFSEGFARRVDGPQSEAKVAELISHLPKDIATEIMSRVPPDTLVEAKRVSKSWYALITELINNVVFVSKHLDNTKNQSSKCLAFSDLKFNPDGYQRELHAETFSLITIFNDQTPSIIEEFNLPLPPPEVFDCPGPRRLIFQCDGIVCLVQLPRTIYICNPVLHECRIVPEFGSADFEAIGIGYDSRAKDYKLVMICNDGVYRSKVYSFNYDSWTVIKMPEDLNIRRFHVQVAFYWSGVCYWIVEGFGQVKIVCFDMCDDKFYVLNLPKIHGRKNRWVLRLYLTTWNGSLALYIYYMYDINARPSCNSRKSFEIFVLDGDCVFKGKGCPSWTQRCVSPPLEGIRVTFSPIEDDELLLQSKDYRLSTYNVRTHKRNGVMGQDTDTLCDWLCLYEKSLVSVKKMKKLSTERQEEKAD